MYKIYFGDKALWLVSDENQALRQTHSSWLLRNVEPDPQFLREAIATHLLQQQKEGLDALILQSADTEALFRCFSSLYYLQEAAGGLVYNEKKELLAIYRRGFWDLPKGKIEVGETHEQAALREVEEETGLQGLQIGHFLACTYHVYSEKNGQQILKRTYWWTMQAAEQPLVPQVEESIEKAVWIAPLELLHKKPIFNNIVDIVTLALR